MVFNPESQDQASNTKVKQIEPLLEGMIGMILANENAFAHDNKDIVAAATVQHV